MLITAAQSLITYGQAIVLGVLQGVTELFPISSLGHTVIFPNLFGWDNIVAWQSQSESPWLAFVVMLHVGSAIGLLIYFWRTWIEIIVAFFRDAAQAPRRDLDRAAGLAGHHRDDPGGRSSGSCSSTRCGWPWPSRSRRRASWSSTA